MERVEALLASPQTIVTDNVVANVHVRAQSLGPGFCEVSFDSNFGSTGFLAPPLSWSDWNVLFSHTGSVSAGISSEAKCDTGALFEVKYFG